MIHIKLLTLDKYNAPKYKRIEDGIYQKLEDDDASYRVPISFQLEEGENTQYPLEDILDKFYLHVSDSLESENNTASSLINIELCGELEDVKKVFSIIGKRVYNEEYQQEGKTYVRLKIE